MELEIVNVIIGRTRAWNTPLVGIGGATIAKGMTPPPRTREVTRAMRSRPFESCASSEARKQGETRGTLGREDEYLPLPLARHWTKLE